MDPIGNIQGTIDPKWTDSCCVQFCIMSTVCLLQRVLVTQPQNLDNGFMALRINAHTVYAYQVQIHTLS